jgi:tetratricopeptide (TPR) repeat protein
MRGELARGKLGVILAGGAVGCGAAGWLLLGPVGLIAGVVAGPVIALLALVVVLEHATPDPVILLNNGRPQQAAAQIRGDLQELRALARMWPGVWRDALADRLIVLSGALHAMHRDVEALRPATEAVAIYQGLAAKRPDKYAAGLADALDRQARLLAAADRPAEALAAMEVAVRLQRNLAAADPGKYLPILAESLDCQAGWLARTGNNTGAMAAAYEATAIYRDRLPWTQASAREARRMLLEGELLCQQGRYHEATRLLAQGWHKADTRYQQDALWQAAPTLRAAYRANPDGFVAVWHAETSREPPPWLSQRI